MDLMTTGAGRNGLPNPDLNPYHGTAGILRPPLPTTTGNAGSQVAIQGHAQGTGHPFAIRHYAGNQDGQGDFRPSKTVESREPSRKRQRTGESGDDAGLLSQPRTPLEAGAAGKNPWDDPQKNYICTSYGTALQGLNVPGLTPQARMEKLEAFRTTCHRLVNESWQLLRMELADEVAAAGEAHYLQLTKQAHTSAPPFYDGFDPWGLQVLNASLAQLPMPGPAVQVCLLPKLAPQATQTREAGNSTITTEAGKAGAARAEPHEALMQEQKSQDQIAQDETEQDETAQDQTAQDDLEPLFIGWGDDDFR